MANTERMKVLKIVNEAKNMANAARTQEGLPRDQREVLEDLFIRLSGIEDAIFQAETEEALAAMEQSAGQLKEVNARLKMDIASLKQVAGAVNQVAKAVGMLVDLLTRAAELIALA